MSEYLEIAREIMRDQQRASRPESATPLENALKGQAVELWSDILGERFWLVADEDDAMLLGEPRGTIYTAAEARRIVHITDSNIVAEVHRWKRGFDATVRECQRSTYGEH